MFILKTARTVKNNKASSRLQINIKSIEDGVLLMPGGKYRKIISVNPINLELKSEAEQDQLIDGYKNFLNSLNCSLQVLIRVREQDLDSYLESFNQRYNQASNVRRKKQIQSYCEFVRQLVEKNKILTRKFYIVIPFADDDKSDMAAVRENLKLRQEIITKGLAKIGIFAHELNSAEIMDLFYSFYNPEAAKLYSFADMPGLQSLVSGVI